MKIKNFYLLISVLCIAGYAWIGLDKFKDRSSIDTHQSICIIKNVSGIPCPSCGTTRSVHAILAGKPIEAMMMNPLGYLTILILFLMPLWLLWDLFRKKASLYNTCMLAEHYLRTKKWAIPLSIILMMIWIKNIIHNV